MNHKLRQRLWMLTIFLLPYGLSAAQQNLATPPGSIALHNKQKERINDLLDLVREELPVAKQIDLEPFLQALEYRLQHPQLLLTYQAQASSTTNAIKNAEQPPHNSAFLVTLIPPELWAYIAQYVLFGKDDFKTRLRSTFNLWMTSKKVQRGVKFLIDTLSTHGVLDGKSLLVTKDTLLVTSLANHPRGSITYYDQKLDFFTVNHLLPHRFPIQPVAQKLINPQRVLEFALSGQQIQDESDFDIWLHGTQDTLTPEMLGEVLLDAFKHNRESIAEKICTHLRARQTEAAHITLPIITTDDDFFSYAFTNTSPMLFKLLVGTNQNPLIKTSESNTTAWERMHTGAKIALMRMQWDPEHYKTIACYYFFIRQAHRFKDDEASKKTWEQLVQDITSFCPLPDNPSEHAINQLLQETFSHISRHRNNEKSGALAKSFWTYAVQHALLHKNPPVLYFDPNIVLGTESNRHMQQLHTVSKIETVHYDIIRLMDALPDPGASISLATLSTIEKGKEFERIARTIPIIDKDFTPEKFTNFCLNYAQAAHFTAIIDNFITTLAKQQPEHAHNFLYALVPQLHDVAAYRRNSELIKAIRLLVTKLKIDINSVWLPRKKETTVYKTSMLHAAIDLGWWKLFKTLLNLGANPNVVAQTCNNDQLSATQYAMHTDINNDGLAALLAHPLCDWSWITEKWLGNFIQDGWHNMTRSKTGIDPCRDRCFILLVYACKHLSAKQLKALAEKKLPGGAHKAVLDMLQIAKK